MFTKDVRTRRRLLLRRGPGRQGSSHPSAFAPEAWPRAGNCSVLSVLVTDVFLELLSQCGLLFCPVWVFWAQVVLDCVTVLYITV
jgi:hypothetical protein